MKFTTAVSLLALAMGAQSSAIPYGSLVLGGHHHIPAAVNIAESPIHVPTYYGNGHGSVAIQASNVAAYSPYTATHGDVQVLSTAHGLPAHLATAHGHPQIISAAPALPSHLAAPATVGATFVAKNRGAVHVAPLPGHVQSVVSENLTPAAAVPAITPYAVAAHHHTQVLGASHAVSSHLAAPIPAGGTFVAKNRGAVHVAPLPGHLKSVVSANLAPAPGTY